jgi:putative OPT family oligopeptide transporter
VPVLIPWRPIARALLGYQGANLSKPATSYELTPRAVLTGMAVGALLAPCNIYSGLKIGWTFNMSVAAGLLGLAFWQVCASLMGTRSLALLENNINQTAASSAAAITSSGLAAPIPALALITGQILPWEVLAIWLFAVSAVGVVVGAALRNQMLERENLPFPPGIATAETMLQIHSGRQEARDRLRALFGGMAVSAALKIVVDHLIAIPKLAPPFVISLGAMGQATFANLGLALEPSLLMTGFGAIAGLRIGISALIGAVLAWGFLAPYAASSGWAQTGPADPVVSWFGPLVEWLLWPGVTLMVTSALMSFALSIAAMIRRRRAGISVDTPSIPRTQRIGFAAAFLTVLIFASAAQVLIFGIGPVQAVVAVLLTFVLAAVAARVAGETGITPVGALGKVTQLSFGVLAPASPTTNLMTANVTGGASDHCADMLQDLRTGQIIGATAEKQYVAQVFGVLAGSLAGSIAYLALIPDPQGMLISEEWPAPAVATWKAVAEVLSGGLSAMPPAAGTAMLVAAIAGAGLAIAERALPQRWLGWVPSAGAMGLSFVIPAWNSISLFLGAAAAAAISRLFPAWAERKLVVLAAGLVVGESLAGVLSVFIAAFG